MVSRVHIIPFREEVAMIFRATTTTNKTVKRYGYTNPKVLFHASITCIYFGKGIDTSTKCYKNMGKGLVLSSLNWGFHEKLFFLGSFSMPTLI